MTMRDELTLQEQMRTDWNMRAERDPLHWTVNLVPEGKWDLQKYLQTGEDTLASLDAFLDREAVDPSGLSVFEVGCGAGRITCGLAKRFRKVIGMDISDTMVQAATSLLAGQDLDNVKLFVGNGTNFKPQRANSVDVVYSVIVFQHIPSVDLQLGYLSDTARILRSGGLFCISLYNDEKDYQHKLSWWEGARRKGTGFNELVQISLSNFETTMQTYIPAELVDKTLDENGLELMEEDGRGTHTWWIRGRKI